MFTIQPYAQSLLFPYDHFDYGDFSPFHHLHRSLHRPFYPSWRRNSFISTVPYLYATFADFDKQCDKQCEPATEKPLLPKKKPQVSNEEKAAETMEIEKPQLPNEEKAAESTPQENNDKHGSSDAVAVSSAQPESTTTESNKELVPERKEVAGPLRLRLSVDSNENGLIISSPIPSNVKSDNVSVKLDGQMLTVSAKTQSQDKHHRSVSKFSQSIRLGDECDTDNISAQFEGGVLKITAPRKVNQRVKQIPITN